jgi:hypothetical protein
VVSRNYNYGARRIRSIHDTKKNKSWSANGLMFLRSANGISLSQHHLVVIISVFHGPHIPPSSYFLVVDSCLRMGKKQKIL